MNRIIITLFFLVISASAASAQDYNIFDNISIGGGLTTFRITGVPFVVAKDDNPNTWTMIDYDSEHPSIGGSFDVVEPGFGVMVTLKLNEEETFYLPIGIDYFFLNSKERLPLSRYLVFNLTNQINILSPHIGFNYAILKLPLAAAKIYVGAEARGIFLHNKKFIVDENWKLFPDRNQTVIRDLKENAFRLGGGLKIGVQGNLLEPFEINTSIGYSVINLVGRDNERGELFTPIFDFETQETLTGAFIFSLMVQYRF